jgi:hypothetical protein
MCPFTVTVEHVPDRELGPLLARLSEAGFANPIVSHVDAGGLSARTAASARPGSVDLPEDWRLTHERRNESYRWPKKRDSYSPYRVFLGTTRAERAVQIGLGERSARTPGDGTASTLWRSSAAARRSIRWSSSLPPTTSKPRASAWR